jgi:hypothetical protein
MSESVGRWVIAFKAWTEAPHSGRVRSRPKGRAGSFHALLIVATSSDRLFLNGVLASIARLRFTGNLILIPFRDLAQSIYSERSTVS